MMTEVPVKKRGPYAPSARRRVEITEAVLAIVDEVGPESVTVALVAERVRANEGTVLYHFPTKDHLLVAALELSDELAAAAAGVVDGSTNARLDFERLSRPPEPGDPRQRLNEILRGAAASPGHPARDYLRRRDERAVEIFTQLIARQQQEGAAHPGLDPGEVAEQVLALMEGVAGLTALGMHLDTHRLLLNAFRRLTGANWMVERARLLDDRAGL